MHRRATYGARVSQRSSGRRGGAREGAHLTVEDRVGRRPELDPDGVDRRLFVADEVVVQWDGSSVSAARPSLPAFDRPARAELPFLRCTLQPFGVPHLLFGETSRMRLPVTFGGAAGHPALLGAGSNCRGRGDNARRGRRGAGGSG
jgi:hypothetical protein